MSSSEHWLFVQSPSVYNTLFTGIVSCDHGILLTKGIATLISEVRKLSSKMVSDSLLFTTHLPNPPATLAEQVVDKH